MLQSMKREGLVVICGTEGDVEGISGAVGPRMKTQGELSLSCGRGKLPA